MRSKLPISAVVFTKNEEKNIEECLQSLSHFSEVVVIDSKSTDSTCEIAVAWGARVVHFSWDGKYPKKNTKYKRKVCKFTADKQLAAALNYKRVDILERFITNRGKILPRRITGTSAKWQRILVREIKKARAAGLLPYKVL